MEEEPQQLNQNKQNSESQNKKQGKKPQKQDKSKEKKQLNIPIFKEYYKEILKQEFENEEQFEHFWKFLQEKLPIAFRINTSLQNIGFFEQNFQKQYIQNINNKFWDLQQLNWLKNVYIIYQNNPMGQDESLKPIQQKFFKEIEIANSAGLLSRQELVSMLPPLLLDPQPEDVVFDACSAPGSKTTQLLEIMHRKALQNNQDVSGAVISNEMNIDRAYVLSHQINRSGSNAQLVVNHLAQFIPSIKINNGKYLQFDKILVDVPCTGDGAARKIPTRFTQFTCKEAFSLFPIQQSCLMKAIQMTKKNGLILYSTCSLSPIENEAVVLDTLRKAKDNSLELIDVHELLPNFKGRKGLLYWKVLFSKIVPQQLNNKSQEEIDNLTYNDFFEEIENFEDLAKKEVKSSKRSPYKLLREGMWPEKDQEKMKNLGLQKTMRVLPQDQNTGGFYVALFRKKEDIVFDENCISEKHQNTENKTNDEKIILSVDDKIGGKTMLDRIKENDTNLFKKLKEQQTFLNSEPYKKVHHEETDVQETLINEEKEIENEQEQENEIQENDKQKQSKKDKLFYEYYRQISEEDYQYLKEFYGLQNLDRQQLITNHEGQEKDKCNKIKLISKKLSEILIQNPENQQTLNLINAGIKVFQRDPKFGLRVSQDGIHHIQKYITKRIYETEFENIAQILGKQRFIYDNIKNQDFKNFLQSQEKGNIIFKTKPVENAEFEYFSVNILEFSIQAMVANIDCKKFQLIYPEIFEKFNSKNDTQILEEQKEDQVQKNEDKE